MTDPTSTGEALLRYSGGDYVVVRPGRFVLCAVSGKSIPLELLKYWSPTLQEAYASPREAFSRLGQTAADPA